MATQAKKTGTGKPVNQKPAQKPTSRSEIPDKELHMERLSGFISLLRPSLAYSPLLEYVKDTDVERDFHELSQFVDALLLPDVAQKIISFTGDENYSSALSAINRVNTALGMMLPQDSADKIRESWLKVKGGVK